LPFAIRAAGPHCRLGNGGVNPVSHQATSPGHLDVSNPPGAEPLPRRQSTGYCKAHGSQQGAAGRRPVDRKKRMRGAVRAIYILHNELKLPPLHGGGRYLEAKGGGRSGGVVT